MRFDILRHGQTYMNAEHNGTKYQGQVDDDKAQLNEAGMQQAVKAGNYISALIEKGEISLYTHIISSDLGRAHKTALTIQDILQKKFEKTIEVSQDERLRCKNWGVYEGTLNTTTYPELENMSARERTAKYPEWKPEGGESTEEVLTRMLEAIKVGSKISGHILYVAHNENIQIYTGRDTKIPNCALAHLKYDSENTENPVQFISMRDTQK